MIMRYPALCLALIAAATACASTSQTGGTGGRPDVITAEQIAQTSALNAYEAVSMLRRNWLISRGSVSISDPDPVYTIAYLDNGQLGDIDSLRGVPVTDIREIRFIDGATAANRYGEDHRGGIIKVITR
jgi:outer membrane cobalamin receptor